MNWSKREPRVGENVVREDARICRYVKQEMKHVGSLRYAELRMACFETVRVLVVAGTAFFPETTKKAITCLSCVAESKSVT
jgi:hypothetical protein